MPESILLDITTVIVLGIGAQWVAWQLRLPSILLLLLVGFFAGPVLGLLDPGALRGDWLFAFVSLSIGIILFEGGLSLRLDELREVGTTILNLTTLGVLITWGLAGAAAYYILDFDASIAVLIGAILTVTGPTVIVPLLRHVRPKGRVGAVAKWEGITIDPVGAILALLVLETLLLLNNPSNAQAGVNAAIEHVVVGLGLEIFVALGVSVVGTIVLVLILRRGLVPDFLRNPVTLMVVVVAFVTANVLQHEAGLLATTIMGIALANQPYTSVHRIVEFKENLQVLLIGSLFVLLSARLELSDLSYIGLDVLIFLALLVVFVRPIAVFLSSLQSNLTWEEKTFLSWMAPRGVVAAAVASLFAFQLRPVYPDAVDGMVPIVFAVIVGTVAIYGLTAAPLAHWLGLADPNPDGLLFVGAAPWVRAVASQVESLDHRTYLIDNNPTHVKRAREEGLQAEQADVLSEATLDDVDLSGTGHLLITIPNDEVASLGALHFSDVLESSSIYQLAASPESRQGGDGVLPDHLRGRPLFGEDTSYATLQALFQEGGEVQVVELTEEAAEEHAQFSYEEVVELDQDKTLVPLFVLRDGEDLEVVSEADQFRLEPDDQLVVLVGPKPETPPPERDEPSATDSPEAPVIQVVDPSARDSASSKA